MDCGPTHARTIAGWDDPDGPLTHGDGVYILNGKAWRVIGPRAIEADRAVKATS